MPVERELWALFPIPEQNRKALVLSGEQHERHWNEMLLRIAAKEIAHHVVKLRDVLKPSALWALIGKAFEVRNSDHFACFWDALVNTVGAAEIVWTTDEKWISSDNCQIPSPGIIEDQELSLTNISVNLVHKSLRPFQNALQALGEFRKCQDLVRLNTMRRAPLDGGPPSGKGARRFEPI